MIWRAAAKVLHSCLFWARFRMVPRCGLGSLHLSFYRSSTGVIRSASVCCAFLLVSSVGLCGCCCYQGLSLARAQSTSTFSSLWWSLCCLEDNEQTVVHLRWCWARKFSGFFAGSEESLRGSPPKTGPLDFATKNSFPLFFVGEEALVIVYWNRYFCFQILILSSATSQKRIESVTASQRVFRRLKLMDFEKCVANNRMPAQKICSIQFF